MNAEFLLQTNMHYTVIIIRQFVILRTELGLFFHGNCTEFYAASHSQSLHQNIIN